MLKRLLASVLLSFALVACGDDDATGPDDDGTIAGRYELITVDGDSLPITQSFDSASVTWVSGHFNLNTDETFTYGFSFTVIQGGATRPESTTGLGLWDQNKSAVFFQYADGSFPDAGTIVGRDMFMTSGGYAFVFRRE